MKPRLIIHQKIAAFINRYEIYEADESGEKGRMLAFAEQRLLTFKEKVDFFDGPDKKNVVFRFRAEKVMDVHGRYFIEDAEGNPVGALRKQFGKSLLNSTWDMLDVDDSVQLTVNESNMVLAIVRRYIGWIPFIGEFLDIATAFIKYHFSFRTQNDDEVGRYRKTTLFRDRYTLSVTDDAYAAQDWRVFAAMAVALDALQSR